MKHQARATKASAQTLVLCALLLTVSHDALAKDDTDQTKIEAPNQSSGLFMEQATYGDVIGLQPGFEKTTTGKALSITPDKPYKKAPSSGAASAKIQNSALNLPKAASQTPAQQFVREIAPILPPGFEDLSLEPYNKDRTLLTGDEQKSLQQRQKMLAKARKRALADLKNASKIAVAAPARDLNQIKAIASDRPALALSTLSDDALAAPRLPAAPPAPIDPIAVTVRNTQRTLLTKGERQQALEQFNARRAAFAQLDAFDVSLKALERTDTTIADTAESAAQAQQLTTPSEALETKAIDKTVFANAQGTADSLEAVTKSHIPSVLAEIVPHTAFEMVPMAHPALEFAALARSTTTPTEKMESTARFASSDGTAATVEAVTTDYSAVTLNASAIPGGLEGTVLEPVKAYPAQWSAIEVAAAARPSSLFSATAYSEIDAEILAEIVAFEANLIAPERDRVLYTPLLVAQAESAITDGLTKSQSLAVIDMVGLPGDAQVMDVKNEDRATLVASIKNTSTKYEAQPIGMGGLETLRDAVEHAVATNPDIKIAEAQQEDAYYAVNEARAGFLPKLDLNAGAGPEVSRQSGQEEIVRIRREVNATLRQTVFDFGLTRYDYLRAKEGYESAKLETLQSIEELVYDVSVSYLGVLQQQRVVALAHQNLEAHEGILNLVNAQKEAGQGTAADVNRVTSSLANARSFMLEEESKLQQSRDEYRRLLNAPPGILVDPLLDLSLLPSSADEAAQRIEAESPQLLQVKADEKSVKNQLRSQRGNYLPKVEFEVQGNMNTDLAGETGQTRDARAMMFLRYNLYNGGADAAVAARLRARVKEVGYEFEKQRREVEQNIRNDFTAIDASRAKVDTIRDQVDSAKEVVRLYEEQFRAGDRTAFDLLDAQQALITAKLEQVLNTYQETRAGFRVMQQLGSLYYALTAED